MTEEGRIPGSFRDPGGFVFQREGVLYRQINTSRRDDYEELIRSGLYDHLTSRGWLIEHEEVDVPPHRAAEADRVLRPQMVPFVSYPYEWCFSQLKDAALLTLDVQRAAMQEGMTLQDASAYNVQFLKGRPVLIDTLSLTRLEEGRPWVAYRQFCQHFLAPLALIAYGDGRLGRLSQLYVDGVPIDLADRLLPWRATHRPSLYMHVRAHSRHEKVGAVDRSSSRGRRFTRRAFEGLIRSLRSTVARLEWTPSSSWVDYYDEASHYSEAALKQKDELVQKFLVEAAPRTVWDLGANTGRFGRIAASEGAQVVSFDVDPASVEVNYIRCRADGERRLLPLVCDLANPSPGVGWANHERSRLKDRGPAELVMALALIHHLAIGNNVPLDRIADLFRELGSWLIAEFVPKEDPKVQELLEFREDVFADYSREGFERAFEQRFSIERTEPIGATGRILYLMRGS